MPQISLVKQTTTYTFKYESDSETIDLNTLLLSQIHFSTILNEIKHEVAGGSNLSIRIKPLERGSVPFQIALDVSWIEQLLHLADTATQHAETIINVLLGLIVLRKELKGRKPAKIEIKGDKVIVTVDDTTIEVDRQVYNIYENNAVVDQAIKKGFEAIDKDEDVTGIKILDTKKKPLLDVPREDFADITEPNAFFEEQKKTEPVRREMLTVFKVVFDKGYKWQFYMNGRKISATMADDKFMEHLKRSTERFGYGDTMEVELQVEQVFDKTLNIYIEKDFTINKVLSHTPRPKQGDIFEDDKEA